MNQYMVAYANLFENTIEMEQVTSTSEVQAIRDSKFGHGLGNMDMIAITSYFFDCDSIIQVKRILQVP